jgi:phosphoglycolate phosphatase
MTSPVVVFDLDGTLIDTATDLVTTINYTIGTAGLAPVTYDDLTFLVGQGARTMIERAFSMRGESIDEPRLTELMGVFVEHYRAGMPGESTPYPGVIAAMERLSGAGYKLAVCTNKMESLAVRLLDGLGLSGHFAAVTGGDTFPVRKPDARHLTETIARAGGTLGGSVMIGDSVNDIMAARNANVPSIAVPFGYSDVPVAELSPGRIITHYDELTPGLVKELTSA